MAKEWKEEWIVELGVYGGGTCYLLEDENTTEDKERAYKFPDFKSACTALGSRDVFKFVAREEPEDVIAPIFQQVGWTIDQWKDAGFDPEVLPGAG